MGIDINGARFLLDAARNGVIFDKTAMLGRQEMHLGIRQLEEVFRRFSLPLSVGEADAIIENGGGRNKGYAESFLKKCGATSVTSFDNSDFEGATVVHDMNRDIPDEYHAGFDCVLDSGTLEHVFNIPVALRNCLSMVKPGGHFLSITICNNFMGHGFYQFSPELFYGVLSAKNGYAVERMFIFESRPDARWYRVADPKKIGGRVELINSVMTYLLVQARRVSDTGLSDITPQQSDYTVMWDGKIPGSTKLRTVKEESRFRRFKGVVKGAAKNMLRHLPVETFRTPFNPPWYEPYE